MTTKRETTIHRNIIRWLNEHGWMAWKIHGSAFGRGWPDIIALRGGHTWFIEVKTDNKQPDALQKAIMGKLQKAGATVFVAHSLDEVKEQISARWSKHED